MEGAKSGDAWTSQLHDEITAEVKATLIQVVTEVAKQISA
jgi:hypothetical protein